MKQESKNPWTKLSSKTVFTGHRFKVLHDEVMRPDKTRGTFEVIVRQDASVVIVAMTDNQEVVMIGLRRYTTDTYGTELPAGGTDGEDPLVAAKRELKEETGFEAKMWKKLGQYNPYNGQSGEFAHVFLASELKQTNENEQQEEGIDKTITMPLKDTLDMVKRGEITDGYTIIGLMLAVLELGIGF